MQHLPANRISSIQKQSQTFFPHSNRQPNTQIGQHFPPEFSLSFICWQPASEIRRQDKAANNLLPLLLPLAGGGAGWLGTLEAKWKSAGYVTICIFMQTILAQLWGSPYANPKPWLIRTTFPPQGESSLPRGTMPLAAAFGFQFEVNYEGNY